VTCPRCGSENTPFKPRERYQDLVLVDWICLVCGYEWSVVAEIGKEFSFMDSEEVIG
jgi:hypothetical protein